MLHKIALLTLAPFALAAQSGVTFTYQLSGASGVTALTPGATIAYPTIAAGSAAQAAIYCFNQSASALTLSASVNNALFTASTDTTPIASGSSGVVYVTYNPKVDGTTAATLTLTLTAPSGAAQNVQFSLSAQALDGILASVTFASNGSQVLLPDGAAITFAPIAAGVTATALFTITNRTSSPVSVGSILVSGTAFQLFGLPLMPAALPAGGQMTAGISFSPGQTGTLTGNLTYSVSGVTHRLLLSGTEAAASLQFSLSGGALAPGAAISFPSVAVGTPAVVKIQITNSGSAPAVIQTMGASPALFVLQNAPGLPLSIDAGGSASLTVAFVPVAPGTITGSLQVGSTSFALSGVGLGPLLSCAITARGQAVGTCNGSTITLPSVSLGDQLAFTVQVTNSGNQPGSLENFAVGGNGFAASAPSLPATVAAGSSLQVNATFVPAVIGLTGGYLQINGQTFNVTVAATAPPSLPAITFTNVTPQMQPLQQPSVGIQLASPYPYSLAGTLTLGFTADSLIDDPSIQFLNGQRYVQFTVPAGSTNAVFGTTATGVIFQSGSTSGVISLSASFTLGQYVLTGTAPVTQNIAIPAAAPQIQSLQIAGMNTSTFQLLLTGFSTARSVTQLAFTLTPTANGSLTTTTLTADVTSAFNSWFQSAQSHSFGGQFSVTVNFNVTGDISMIQSVTASATDAQGTSTPVSVNLQSTSGQ